MKGQAQAISFVTAAIFVAVAVLIGTVTFGIVADVVPHDQTINNETMCATCVNGSPGNTRYEFINIPVLNDTAMVCFNDSNDLMTNGVGDSDTCLGYNIENNQFINISNASAVDFCQISNVVCTYTFDEANTNEQSFFDNTTSTSYSGFILAAVIVIVLAAVGVMAVVLLIRG